MPPRLKASVKGLAKIEQAREEKGWTKTDARACREASKILEPNMNWETEQIKLDNIFADGVSTATWKRFLNGIPIKTESFKAFCQILKLDYLEICRNIDVKINARLDGSCSEENKAKIALKLIEIQKLFNNEPITLIEIKEGSIVIRLQSSIKGYEKLLELSASGQLQQILGFPIESIELKSVEPTDTREWLENLFNTDWQPVETVLVSSSIRSSVIDAETSETMVSKAKVIYLSRNICIVAIVRFTLSDEEIQASLEIYPAANNAYLPEGLTIEILDESEAIAIRKEVESDIDSVQIPFSFEPEEEFKIRFTLENISITENLFSY